jgi:uncharacterized lipoprotein
MRQTANFSLLILLVVLTFGCSKSKTPTAQPTSILDKKSKSEKTAKPKATTVLVHIDGFKRSKSGAI